jgi:hypothetical protein
MEIGIIINDDSNKYSHMSYMDEYSENLLPTLIVGWANVKTLFGDKVSIRKNEVSKGIFWCFSRSERRSDYENSIDEFNKECIKKYCDQFSYVFLDLICDSRKKIMKIIREIYRNEGHFTISNNQMMYIYFNNIIIGIDINQLYYIGIDNSKIMSKLKGTNYKFLYYSEIFKIGGLPKLNNKKYNKFKPLFNLHMNA